MRLIYHPEAELELIEAAQFYERKVRGLGEQFLSEFDAAVKRIQKSPDRWPAVTNAPCKLQRFLMARFPYGIYYRVMGDELRILVVKHHSRHPDYWKNRLKS
ncbi:MAG: type II toxin-antitoxin system RelE/ParE family toxin [Verrucomicrobiota bacterium]